jgi:hypothetical protein
MLKKIFENKKLVSDIILIGLLLIISLSAFIIYMTTREDIDPNEAHVVVSVNSKVYAKYPLSKDGVYFIQGYNGGTNTLVIKDGEAYISDASCPKEGSDVPCTKQGKLSADGLLRTIVCLPNRVDVELVGGDNDGGLDI